jgi:hypothetical protein
MLAYKESTSVKYQRSYCYNDIKFSRHVPFLVNPSTLGSGPGRQILVLQMCWSKAFFSWQVPVGNCFLNEGFICPI